MNLYFFDCDKTLYDFNFRKRLPKIAELTYTSQYHLASTWWVGGHERDAEAGKYITSDDYFAAFYKITGAHLTLAQYQHARKIAMTPNPGCIDAFRRSATMGNVAVLSNNPIPFFDSVHIFMPEIIDLIGPNALISAQLGARKPDSALYKKALQKFDAHPHDAIFIDDSATNVEGARAVGMHAHQLLRNNDGTFDIGGLNRALDAFNNRDMVEN